MSNYNKLSHTIYKCQYHLIFCPKYRYKVLENKAGVLVRNQIYKLYSYKDGVMAETINIQPDHVHLVLSIPPKYCVSEIMGYLKGKIARKLFQEQEELSKQYWGKHIWSRGYCVSTIGLEEDQIKKYVKWAQARETKG